MASSVWSNVVRDFMDAYGAGEEAVKFSPSPADVSDCMVALGWCAFLERGEFNMIWWRSFDISFGVIAARLGRSDETARRRYNEAIEKVWYASIFEQAPQ